MRHPRYNGKWMVRLRGKGGKGWVGGSAPTFEAAMERVRWHLEQMSEEKKKRVKRRRRTSIVGPVPGDAPDGGLGGEGHRP